jgi:hypothetical protein
VVNIPYHAHLGTPDSDDFNVFPGFKATFQEGMTYDQAKKKCRPILDHIYNVWGRRGLNNHRFLLECIVKPIRELIRNEIFLTLIGEEGCGKSCIFEFLEKFVCGKDLFLTVCGLESITRNFNSALAGKLFVFIDEAANMKAEKAISANEMERMKKLITGSTIQIEPKGKDTYIIDNYLSPILGTNNKLAVRWDGAARRAQAETCETLNNFHLFTSLTPKQYFNELYSHFTQEMGDAFYTFCVLSKPFCDLRAPHVSDTLREIKEESKPLIHTFFRDVFESGEFSMSKDIEIEIEDNDEEVSKEVYIRTARLYRRYEKWHKITNNGKLWSMDAFTKYAKTYPGLEHIPKKQIAGVKCSRFKVNKSLHENITVIVDKAMTPLLDFLSS